MRRMIMPLLVAGVAQWAALGWWRFVDGVTVNLSLGLVIRELFGVEPRIDWGPAQLLLMDVLSVTPGTLFLLAGGYLLLRGYLAKRIVNYQRQRHLERQRRELLATRRTRAAN